MTVLLGLLLAECSTLWLAWFLVAIWYFALATTAVTLPSCLLLKEELTLLSRAPDSSGSDSLLVSSLCVFLQFLIHDFCYLVYAKWVTTLIIPGVQMFKYPVPDVYFRTDLGHFFKNDYHNYFWLQTCQMSFFAWFPDVDSKIRETTMMPITISLHVLHHHFVLTPWRFHSCLTLPLAIILRYLRSS